MKSNRTYIFITISSIALLIVLSIQVKWIYETTRIKEEIFNEKANMVLSRTAEAISSDEQACRKLESGDGTEIRRTDSLFTNYMQYYNFNSDFSFAVSRPGSAMANNEVENNDKVYKKLLEEEASQNGLELNLFVPDKKQMIMEEMKTLFITSVILIIIVLVLFWRTILSLMKEKRLSEHTNDFLNNMTHEFKTPLTNIALAGRMIVKDNSLQYEERIKHLSGIILEENEKLKQQVEQVLGITALERGEIPLHKSQFDFHALIKKTIDSISIQLESTNGRVELNLQAENFMILGDQLQFSNALCNLLDNAIKYSVNNPDISVSTNNSDHFLVIAISDKGPGIDKEYQKKIFDKYFRIPTGNVHDVKGFGLGLAYVKKVVELHEGTIALRSGKGKGTSFIVTIPYV